MTTTRTRRVLKVCVPITLLIDVDAYANEYGHESIAAIREDVKCHVTDSITQHLDSLGVLADPNY